MVDNGSESKIIQFQEAVSKIKKETTPNEGSEKKPPNTELNEFLSGISPHGGTFSSGPVHEALEREQRTDQHTHTENDLPAIEPEKILIQLQQRPPRKPKPPTTPSPFLQNDEQSPKYEELLNDLMWNAVQVMRFDAREDNAIGYSIQGPFYHTDNDERTDVLGMLIAENLHSDLVSISYVPNGLTTNIPDFTLEMNMQEGTAQIGKFGGLTKDSPVKRVHDFLNPVLSVAKNTSTGALNFQRNHQTNSIGTTYPEGSPMLAQYIRTAA